MENGEHLVRKRRGFEEAEPSQMLCLKAFRCFSHIFEKMRFAPKNDAEMAPKSIENRPRGGALGTVFGNFRRLWDASGIM